MNGVVIVWNEEPPIALMVIVEVVTRYPRHHRVFKRRIEDQILSTREQTCQRVRG